MAITPFQLTDDFTMENFNSKFDEANVSLNQMVNPNLLDNGYFVNPVNQRGQTEYTGTGYTIDRWRNLRGNLVVSTTAVELVPVTTGTTYWHQFIENPSKYAGQTVTFSVLMDAPASSVSIRRGNASLSTASIAVSETSGNKKLLTGSFVMDAGITNVGIYVPAADSTNKTIIYAAKLELGTEQTLAHQEDGVWVLNEIPNYAEELAKCQRYQRVVSDIVKGSNSYGVLGTGYVESSGTRAQIDIPLAVPLRARPSVSIIGNISGLSLFAVGTAAIVPTAVALDQVSDAYVTLNFTIPQQTGGIEFVRLKTVAVGTAILLDSGL